MTKLFEVKKKRNGFGRAAQTSKRGMGSGNPKSERERAATHKRLFGTSTLPKRGTGLQNPYQAAADRAAVKDESRKTA